MSQKNLKLVKRLETPVEPPAVSPLTPSEEAEVSRFKDLTLLRANRRAAVQRLIAKFQQEDELSNAA